MCCAPDNQYLTLSVFPVGEAAGVAKSALGKLGKTLSDTVTALVPQTKQSPPARSPPRQRYGRSDSEYGRLYPWYITSPYAACLGHSTAASVGPVT